MAHEPHVANLHAATLQAPWVARAACRGHPNPEWWFPGVGGTHASDAQTICKRCPVRTECLDYALDAPELHGIWGGQAERSRRRLRRRRQADARAARTSP